MTSLARRTGALILLVCFAGACDRSITVIEPTQHLSDAGCFSCHGDSTLLEGITAQWERSRHARIDDPAPIHCFDCHAPHTRADFSLRITGPTTLQNGHVVDLGDASVCGACHQSRDNVDTTVRTPSGTITFTDANWGPYSNTQADIFAGSNGYEYPLVPYFDGPHLDRMPDGCLHCHFDVAVGSVFGGHTFAMRSGPAPDDSLNTAACNQSGCHTGLEDFDHDDIQSDVRELLSRLGSALQSQTLLDANGTPVTGRVVASSDTAGAVWNYLMVREDRSLGVHNPDYVLDLLGSSLLFVGGTLPTHMER